MAKGFSVRQLANALCHECGWSIVKLEDDLAELVKEEQQTKIRQQSNVVSFQFFERGVLRKWFETRV